ncbi:MAG: uroporphyrinogen-III C-methyltransferase [Mycobacteriales bacterium]
MSYPLLLDLRGRRAVVVGAGPVAVRRARGLLDAGAEVLVIAPALADAIRDWVSAGVVAVEQRTYTPGDLDGAWVVQACTDDPQVNAAVAADAKAARIPCVRADSAADGTARTPAVARDGDVVVAVNTAGDPRRAARIRDEIGLLLTDRGREDLGPGGWVALVGAGPGDPGLATVRARLYLAQADVVVVDRLAPDARDLLGAHVEIIDVGKSPGEHRARQHDINALLVQRALRGLRVVRWKGGDPFVLGRGGEELAACVEAGVVVHVVPGVSSAIAGASLAGIPLTHRGITAEFTVVSAHRDPATSEDADWARLGGGTGTVVVMMGMGRIGEVCEALISAGRKPSTPVAVVQNASLPDQRVAVATLADIPDAVARQGLGAPAVVIIGEVVARRAPTSVVRA